MSRDRQLTEKGRVLLEENLRRKCASAIRAAKTHADLLGPLLLSTSVHIDADSSPVHATEQTPTNVHFRKFMDALSSVE